MATDWVEALVRVGVGVQIVGVLGVPPSQVKLGVGPEQSERHPPFYPSSHFSP